MREFGDFPMSVCRRAVSIHGRLTLAVRGLRMFKSLPRMLVPSLVIQFPVLLASTMSMRR
jgi:hypothetical protein